MNLQQRIDDCLEDMANAYDYDDRQELLADFVEMELRDQRKLCADKATMSRFVYLYKKQPGGELVSVEGNNTYRGGEGKYSEWVKSSDVYDDCINAVEKK